MIQEKPVIVKEFPSSEYPIECRRFFRELRTDLAEAYRPQVILDLSCVQHMTAQGVDLLVRCIREIAERDGELKLVAALPATQLVLELTQINGVAESYDSVEEALESWSVSARTSPPALVTVPVPQAA